MNCRPRLNRYHDKEMVMKFAELPECLIEEAAKTLSRELEGMVTWDEGKRTDKAREIAESVRDSFIKLCDEN